MLGPMHKWLCLALVSLTLPLWAAEHTFDFSAVPEGQTPPGFRSAVTGQGKPGEWRVLQAPVPSLMPSFAAGEERHAVRLVLAQVAQDPTDEHFPLLIYQGDTYGDFTLTTRFETVRGTLEQMAGLAFRIQDESNYYVVRASSLGNTFKFYKVSNGRRGPLVGPEVRIPTGTWHELGVTCKGSAITCSLDGKPLISVDDKANSFAKGKIGFWTKSDSVSYFADTRIVYIPFEPPAQALVTRMLKRYPRLLGLKIYVPGAEPHSTRVVASAVPSDLGEPGGKTEQAVIAQAETWYGKEKHEVSVIMPLRDRNGDPIAAVRVVMKSFPGQTEENAIVRAAPVVRNIQAQVQSLEDLAQ
jgi:3-keto-disaccharide hydrolase